MGLIQEVQELADTNKQLTSEYLRAKKEAEKATKEAEKLAKKLELARQEKENQKEYERGLKKAVENDLITTFSRCFESEGLENAYINLRLKKTRDEILQNVPENEFEARYIDENYERILEKVKKIYKNDFEAKEEFNNKYGNLIQNEKSKKWIEEINKRLEKNQKNENENEKLDYILGVLTILIPLAVVGGIIAFFIWGYFHFAIPILNG